MTTISDYAKSAGVSPSAVRYYESEGILPAPARRAGRRIYEKKDLALLKVVVAARQAGFKIRDLKHLKVLSESDSRGTLSAAAMNRAQEIETQICELQKTRDFLIQASHCNCPSLNSCRTILSR